MSDRKENAWIPKLKQQLADGAIDRREFVRYTTLLGLSAGAAYLWAGKITGQPFAPPARAQAVPKGGTLKIGMRVLKIDDPHTYSWVQDSNVCRQVCEYLTKTGSDNVTRPYLFSSWKASDDLKTWNFTVADAKWRKGRPFTAEDAAWNLKRVLEPKTGSSVVGLMKGYLLDEFETGEKDDKGNPKKSTRLWDSKAIEVVDAKTLRLNLKAAQVAVPEHLFHYPLLILDPEEGGKFGPGSNGTGAFELVDHRVSERSVLRARKSGYWGDGPYLDELHFIDHGDNASAAAAALSSKQVHGIYEGNVEQLDLYKAMSHVQVHQIVTAQTAVVRMRIDQKPFTDPKVRMAVRLATNPAQCVEIAVKGLGEPAEHHHVCKVHPDYKKLDPFNRNVEQAKKLLAEAGYPNGIDVEIACKPDPTWELSAVETMVGQWKPAGIRAKINSMPSAKYWEIWDKVPFGFTTWTHRPLGLMVLGLAYRTGVPWNETAYSNKKFDELLTKAEGILDVKARAEVIGELEKIMQEDGPIAQPLWRSVFTAYDKRVKGYKIHPTFYLFGNELGIEA